MTTQDVLAPIGDQGREEPALRDAASLPLAQAARSLQEISRPFTTKTRDPAGIDDLACALRDNLAAQDDSDLMLYTQARILDAMFKRIVLRDMHGPYKDEHGIPFLRPESVNLALRSQKQCRTTLEALEAQRQRKQRDDHD